MDLLTPGTGLILWQLIIFVALFFLLSKLAWKPIINALKERETSIQDALSMAEKARVEMAQLKSDNEKLLKEAREERDRILREARQAANALKDIKVQVSMFSLQIAEKLLKKNLADDKAQKDLVQGYINDIKVN